LIKVLIFKDKNGFVQRYSISGHAGYDIKGQDIVCAAVSVLAQTVLISLVEVCNIKEEDIDYFIDEKKGILDVYIPKTIDIDTRNKVQVILETLEVGIKSIIESYPEYVILEYGEV
jgi:uncharacterized protein YsxB (DUF464 family)